MPSAELGCSARSAASGPRTDPVPSTSTWGRPRRPKRSAGAARLSGCPRSCRKVCPKSFPAAQTSRLPEPTVGIVDVGRVGSAGPAATSGCGAASSGVCPSSRRAREAACSSLERLVMPARTPNGAGPGNRLGELEVDVGPATGVPRIQRQVATR